ncbi:efflux RND transporter periplasmic adaptor subunit [Cytophaga hutchinsonii]|nr:efflux RND transporter periplasmic adaptor subunit [Cytophaga hutchinsonii]
MKNIVLGLTLLIVAWSCNKESGKNTPDNVFYTCSMDPQVMEKKPGKCPICKMDLTKVIIDKNDMQSGLKLNNEQEQSANIKTLIISEGDLGREKTVNGRIVINENKRFKISSRVSGRIEKLYIKSLGETISKGVKLYDLYSEDLLVAQREYLIAIEKSKEFSGSELDYIQLADGAKNKLILWGMNENQIKSLINKKELSNTVTIYSPYKGVVTSVNKREGDYVMDGDVVFETADLSTLWVEAELYAGEVNEFDVNDPVAIKIIGFPGKIWNSRIDFFAPQLQTQSKVNLVRAEISNTDMSLRPGMQANIVLKENTKKALFLPLNAILQDSKGATVWIKEKDGSYHSRMVITGIESNDNIEIRSGIEAGEEVVINGAYLLNSEYIFKKGTNPMAGHDMSNM